MESARRARPRILAALTAIALVASGALMATPAMADEPVETPVGIVETPAAVVEEARVEVVEETPVVEDAPVDETAEAAAEGEPTPATDEPATDEPAADGAEAPAEAIALAAAPLVAEAITDLSVFSTVAPGNVESGSASWGLSKYLGSANMGRPNPLASAYVAPASFDTTTRIASWGAGSGSVQADGSASIAFAGTSVNFAPTGGAWLRLADLEAQVDASGNGTLSAVVTYGLAPGVYPNITYDPAQTPQRGPQRVAVMTLSGNSATQATVTDTTAAWSALAGTWAPEFLTFLAGDSTAVPAVPGFIYAGQINNTAADRPPLQISFALELTPPVVVPPTEFDLGSASWGLSKYLGSANMGRPNPLANAYVAPASFDTTTRIATWGAGSGTVQSNGSATVAFEGTSVNFAPTGGAWLRLADLQAQLDASGNGTVTAVVTYGLAPGVYPNITYDPAQTPVRGPQRVPVLTLSGNTSAQVALTETTAAWSALAGVWAPEFLTFLAGDATAVPAVPGFIYAGQINNTAADRPPLQISFELGITPPIVPTATTTTLAVSPGTSVAPGTALTLTATVAPATAGTVEFRRGATVLGTTPVTAATGIAALQSTAPGAGSVAYSAVFTPADAVHFLASTGSAAVEVVAPPAAAPGVLSWGVKSSFANYITTTAHGSVTASGVGTQGGLFQFGQVGANGIDPATGTGTVNYTGSVRYTGHNGVLDITLANPTITVHSPTSGTLSLTVNGSRVAFASLALGSASRTADGWSGVPVTLTAAGAAAFAGYYSAGESFDLLSFVAGSPTGSLGGTVTTAAFVAPRTPAATPPATTGLSVLPGSSLVPGGLVSVEAAGFEPNEAGILVVLYSDPVLLDTITADADGVARWSGRLPVTLTGEHTLTLQGSVNRGAAITIVAANQEQCTVEVATLTWGFKETFRSYISGAIANGEWTVADGAEYSTPDFTFTGAGSLDPTDSSGSLQFAGSIRFTGHEGVLDTTVANPRIEVLDSGVAVLLLDVTGTTQSGEPVNAIGVEFADLDLDAVEPLTEDGVLTLAGIPATLTAAGAAAFGTYPAGEALDPITIVVELPADCITEAAPVGGEESQIDVVAPVAPGPDLTWLWWVLGALVLIGAIGAVVLVARSRAKQG